MCGTVLVVDDEVLVQRVLDRILASKGLKTFIAGSTREAADILRGQGDAIDVVLTDLNLQDGTGLDVLATARLEARDAVVIVMTAAATISNAVDAIRAGAYDFLVKPVEPPDALIRGVERALEHKRLIERNRFLEREVTLTGSRRGILGDSAPMRRMLSVVATVAPTDSTVLILGESGTGKELVARAVHDSSTRAKGPFLAVNCGALAESVLESELFGHAHGAFTGAVSARKGLFEAASGGTIFLDEVGETPPSIQVRLLRVLEQREVRPVGSNEVRKVDVRVIAATNRDLAAWAREGKFREDLFYRLNVVSIDVPPLRERSADVTLLAHHFVEQHAAKLKKPTPKIEPEALQVLSMHTWPGNVRELQNAIERSVVLARDEGITLDVLPPQLAQSSVTQQSLKRHYRLPFSEAVVAFERTYIENALREASGNVAEAARLASVDRSNFRRLLKRHGIDAARFAEAEVRKQGSE